MDRESIKGVGVRTNQIGILRGSTGCLKGLTPVDVKALAAGKTG